METTLSAGEEALVGLVPLQPQWHRSRTRGSRMSTGVAPEGRVSGEATVAELLQRAAAGSQDAWDEIVRRYERLVWSVARAHRLDAADAADAVQTTWLRLVEH